MRRWIVAVAFSLTPVLGISHLTACKRCKLIDDPNCDHTKLDNPCPPICAPDDLESSEDGVDEQSAETGIRDAGAED